MIRPNPLRLAVLAVPAVIAIAISGCGSSASGAPKQASLTVTTTEFAFHPMTATAKAGKLELKLVNDGKTVHELVLLKTDRAAGSLPVKGGRVSEADSVGEVSETPAGATKSSTLMLKPGRYVFVCNIPGHYADGMRGTLTVS
ncbi:MAG: hypothetical protein QOI73_1934 [Solirubrobacteraceae bacterium]|nr:hypothetical protein [Solirubrobacteraceae bacterium]